jgi:hypothetical protein
MLPMIINSYKREILYRKAQGRGLLARNKEKINLLLGLQADETRFLSLPETDNIISELKKKRQIFCELIEFSSVTECFKFTSSQIEDRKYYLLMDEDWKYCGAYKIENDFSFSAEFDFDKSKSDEIRLNSIDFSAQISIDYSESCGEKNFEVRIRKYG